MSTIAVPPPPSPAAPAVVVRAVAPDDMPAILRLHALVFGPGRFVRTAYRIREGTPDVSRFCLVALLDEGPASDATLVAAIRMTEVAIGGVPGTLLLGPLAVAPRFAGQGFGKDLVRRSVEAARAAGMKLVLLVGNEPYYGRFGFKVAPAGRILLPGPVDPARLLVAELVPGAALQAAGLVTALAQ